MQVDRLRRVRTTQKQWEAFASEMIALRRSVFALYALLKVHLAEEDLYLKVVEKGVTEEVAGVLAVAMEHPMVPAS